MAAPVFISYSKEAASAAKRLAADLRAYEFRTWLHTDDLGVGDAWSDNLDQAIRSAHAVVFLIAPGYERASNLLFEWSTALEAAWEEPDKRLIPVLLRNADVPPFLRSHRAIQASDPERNWERLVGQVVQALRMTDAEQSKAVEERSDANSDYGRALAERRMRLEELGAAASALGANGDYRSATRDASE